MSEAATDEFTPPDFLVEAQGVISNLLPEKSNHLYKKTYAEFKKWCDETGVTSAKIHKASTLWTRYSMLRSTLHLYDGIDMSKYAKLLAFLKRQSSEYKPKKSKTLTRDQVEEFIDKSEPGQFLLIKVATIIGVCGACRSDELVNLRTNDIEDIGSSLVVTINKTNTKIDRIFKIVVKSNYLELYRTYAKLRPGHTPHDRFFVFYKNGKCSTQPVGKNTLGKIPQTIAKYLNLKDPERYTGHCFRRTSATLLVESGGDLLTLKRHGGWRSSSVAEGYVENSMVQKEETARRIVGLDSIPRDPARWK